MGAKDSKPSFISYEDAVKRVSDSELRRIREAFKRCAGANGTALSLEAFVHEVLCDGVPYEVADWLYQACGGTKRGIAFRELLCGVVVLTKGNIEEKIKFLWTLYVNNQGDNGTYIYKRDFARTLHLEHTSLPVTASHRANEVLLSLFGTGEKVTFDQFRSWLLIHKDATVLSKWLLSEVNIAQDLETPTFYQSLAGVTHLEERDIIELEKCFWSLRNAAPTGQLDAESLSPLLSPPLPAAAVAGAFLAFDENRDGHVDFKELCCGLSAACRGPRTERLKFCFKIFDLDRDGVLNKKELIDMVGILCTVANESLKNQSSRASTPSDSNDSESTEKGFDPEVILVNLREKLVTVPKNGRKPVFQLGPNGDKEDKDKEIVVMKEVTPDSENEGLIANDMALTLEDFLIWSVESAEALVTPFLDLVFEVCHIVLGLRPQCKHQERDIVLGWLRREVQRGYSVGQFWYLIASEWWGSWLAYTAGGSTDACCRTPPRHIDEAIVCDESFTTNSTESMGSLLWRAETASVGSAGSSSGVSSAAAARPHRHPGPIDNKKLLAPDLLKVRTLTGEGGHLRRDVTLAQHRDFELVPDALWRALAAWYGAPAPLPRQVIRPPNSDVELELYPLHLKLLRHVPNTQRALALGGGGGAGASLYSSVPLAPPAAPDRQLAYTAAFSRLATVKQVCEFLCAALGLAREDMRLWSVGSTTVLLDDERPTLHELRLDERARLLLELRNPDLTWPEEIGALSMGSGNRATERRETLIAPNLPGATGLHNLGNTCFMNAALQSVWNTGPLTRYFNSGMHLYEVNTTNPLGTKGVLALRYGELCKEVWSCRARSVAPLRVRGCVSRWARALAGGGQHDAQELLAWLLDALHEDLNRAAAVPRPPAHHHDSDGRPDQVVAAEAWEQHTARNRSIMTDLFYGQLKSKVRCDTCARESVRFDAFNMLSLPLPMESYVCCELRVMLLDGSVPIKYGVRVNSEGTYLDLKKKLSELCGLTPEAMLIVELSGATIGRVFDDGAKISAASALELYAYELPRDDCDSDDSDTDDPPRDTNGWCTEAAQWSEVSVGRGGNTSSLCMPALFCFKRSRSEILMSQSPPNTFYNHATFDGDYRSNTLPKELKKEVNGSSSPTLSVKSLNLKPSSPRLPKVKFGSSPSNMCKMDAPAVVPPTGKLQYLVAVHRKQCRSDAYFLPWQRSRSSLFGVPVLVGVRGERCSLSGRQLYARVWAQVARLLSARPPQHDQHNHATDCDDSLGYEFPFRVRVVRAGGAWCARCPWHALCRGCTLPSDDTPICFDAPGKRRRYRKRSSAAPSAIDVDVPDSSSPIARAKLNRHAAARLSVDVVEQSESDCCTVNGVELGALMSAARRGSVMLAIDWDPTALHLRYQSTREKSWVEHWSVRACRAEAARAVDLASCLRAFTSSERLEQRYHCAACRSAQPATKKLQIWRLPPILIIHLKRFQYVNNKWIKSQKVVNFPFQDFDPTEYLASVPQETILRHSEISQGLRRSSVFVDDTISESDSDDNEHTSTHKEKTKPKEKPERKRKGSVEVRGRQRLESTSLVTTPVTDDNLVDYHQHHLLNDQDPFHLKYRLYAVVSHSGQLSGGHYVAYARNPSGAWLCYNDSSCRELAPGPAPPIDPAAAYLLFYERQGLRYDAYLPDIDGKEPVVKDPDIIDPDDTDLKKMCSIV
ncbi:ubiquitin specific protease 32 isoform X2 [Anticarsia gemmatalis]|uniref:ubiquitin specific protease 32 isoform X2 n=1 Tax=Anticarsia gemmatalis TaxID=129554 RepID=UPI003F759D04